MFGYHLITSSYTHETSTARSDDAWDRADTQTDWTIRGLERNPEYGQDLVFSKDLKRGAEAFVVYVIYNTGDSFGRDDSKYLVPIALFDSAEKAQACVDAIESHSDADDIDGPDEVSFTVKYIDNDGNEQSEYASWKGYFNSIATCDYEKVEVIKG